MTVRKIIESLRMRGYQVEARKRKDGGYLIVSINGIKYVGALGNAEARKILNVSLSKKKEEQLKRIGRSRLAPIPKEVRNQINRINARLRRQAKKQAGREARVTAKQYRINVEKYGEEEALRKLTNLERYHKGYANFDNIRWLLARILKDKELWSSHYWDMIYQLIQSKALTLKDKVMMQIYNILYDVEMKLAMIDARNTSQIEAYVQTAYNQIKSLKL